MYEVHNGKLEGFSGMSIIEASRELGENKNIRRSQEKRMGSQILIKKGSKWNLVKRKRVLYFDLKKTKSGDLKCRLNNDSDSLILSSNDFIRLAHSHYMVFNYLDETGKLIQQKVFNHIGIDILTHKIKASI